MFLSMAQLGLDLIDCKTFWVTETGDDGILTLTWNWDELGQFHSQIIAAIKSGKDYINPDHLGILEIKWD